MPSRLHRLALDAFGRLPARLRRLAVALGTPDYTVGAVCVLTDGDRVLLLCQRHRPDWSLPGGLLDRGEGPADAVRRELREEIGVDVEVDQPLTTLVDPQMRRVDVIYRVKVEAPFEVRPRGEARHAAWKRPEELGPSDELTSHVLAVARAAVRPGATTGRLVG